MKNKLLLLISLLSISVMTAQTITPKNWVTDLGDLYTPEQEANLNSIISAYEKKTSIGYEISFNKYFLTNIAFNILLYFK